MLYVLLLYKKLLNILDTSPLSDIFLEISSLYDLPFNSLNCMVVLFSFFHKKFLILIKPMYQIFCCLASEFYDLLIFTYSKGMKIFSSVTFQHGDWEDGDISRNKTRKKRQEKAF